MGQTTELRRELKARFSPYVAASGFKADLRLQPHSTIFRRRTGDRVEMFELQWDKYGAPRFAVHFAVCPIEGLEVNGKMMPLEDTLPTWCNEVGSLYPGRGFSPRSWFRQDSTWLQRIFGRRARRTPSDVVDELLAWFPEVEQYWANGDVGPHLKIWRRSSSPAHGD